MLDRVNASIECLNNSTFPKPKLTKRKRKMMDRMEEIQAIVQRINFGWENGFITPEEYVEKRSQLQKELEALRPVNYEELMETADLIENFRPYWE